MNRKTFSRKSLSLLTAGVAVAGLIAVAPLTAQEGAGEGPGHGPGHRRGAFEHGPGHFGHSGGRHMERMARFLELTEAQREAARALHEETRAAMEPLHERSRTLHQELRALLDQADPDPLAVGEKAIALDASRDEMRRLGEETHAEFEALLTAEQLEKLEQLHERRGGDRRPGRLHRRGAGHGGH
ncbi:MAG TPA: Spy/CpxP family protein refolding chaperone, partial [Thermoanaerobaculia bacterium]|nr:Spy/CpxP family protein refolding chaperone [Thermoanaerobaculia bacterium]